MRPLHRLCATSTLSAAVVVSYVVSYVVRRADRRAEWGATDDEAAEVIDGDEIVATPRYRTTHALTVEAPVDRVWPWIVQMGQGRGGLYSYDRVENLVGCRIHSLDRIDPALQDLAVGDTVRLVPEGTDPPLRFVVALLRAPYLLVLGPGGTREAADEARLPYPSWTFRLTPLARGRTRLLVRFQHDFAPHPLSWLAYRWALAPIHHVMERKMMLGIKERAEERG